MSKITWAQLFGYNVSENKRSAFDIYCELKSASFRPMNEHWASISPLLNYSWSRTQCCSNELVWGNISFNFCTCHFSVWFVDRLWFIIQIFLPIFSCMIFPFVVNLWYIYFICGIDEVIRSGFIMNWWTFKITIWFYDFGSRTFMCNCVFKSNLFQWRIIKFWH